MATIKVKAEYAKGLNDFGMTTLDELFVKYRYQVQGERRKRSGRFLVLQREYPESEDAFKQRVVDYLEEPDRTMLLSQEIKDRIVSKLSREKKSKSLDERMEELNSKIEFEFEMKE